MQQAWSRSILWYEKPNPLLNAAPRISIGNDPITMLYAPDSRPNARTPIFVSSNAMYCFHPGVSCRVSILCLLPIRSFSLRVQVANEIGYCFEIPCFHHTWVVVSAWERLPDFGGCLTDFVEATHMAWPMPPVSFRSIEKHMQILRWEKLFVVRQDSKVAVIRSQKGLIFCGWNIESSFEKGGEKRYRNKHTVRSHLASRRGRG